MRRAVSMIAAGVGAVAFGQTPPPLVPPPAPRVLIAQSGITPPPDTVYTATRPPAKPATEPADNIYPITLSAALKLAGSRPLDIAIADQQVTLASKQLDRAKLAWVPNLVVGMDYYRHEGGNRTSPATSCGAAAAATWSGPGRMPSCPSPTRCSARCRRSRI